MNQNIPCSSASADFLSPTSTILRIRRKRTTDPLAGLMVSSKKLRTDNEAASTAQPASPDEEKSAGLESREIIYRLVGTSEDYKAAAPFLDSREHKVVEMVDYNPEQNSLGRRQVSVLDHGYLR
uniref:Uncharacterized protein n=1 Tax=Ditylenchus dipsaci TaxID=166011 RepID=A0A915D7A9_9BILA